MKTSATSTKGTRTASTKTRSTAVKKDMEIKADEIAVLEEIDPVIDARTEIEQLKELIKAQNEQINQLKAETQRANTVSYAAVPADERVVFLWQAPVADYNEVTFGLNGRYGRIVGKTGTFFVPKAELSQVLDAPTRRYLETRWLLILSGLDDQEREMFGVDYKPGEYLSKEAFMKVVDMGDDILDIYPGLCEAHKEIVAKFYYEAWQSGKKIKRETVVKLNKLSGNDAFKAILEEMNARDLDEE